MSSIFGTSVDDTSLGLNSTFLVGVTSTTEAIQILDQQLTIFNESNLPNGETAPLNTVINNLNTAITDVGDGLSNNLTASNVKNLYESNPDTNAFTDAYKTIVDNVGQYVDSSELAAALTPYRIATAQDVIDSGKYSTSNPAGYQTSSQVVNSISDALVPYRLATDQDTIDSTKLNTADLKSDIVIHPSNAPTFLGVACCGGLNTTGMARTSTGDITPLSVIPQFPSSDPYSDICNGVVNFKGSNYYSYIFASGKAYTVENNNIYTNVSASTVFTTETATNNFVYKFATDGNVLVCISKSNNSVHIFWTTDGIIWTPYFTNYSGGMREIVIYDGIVYIGTTSDILKLSITDMQANAAYTMHNTGAFINSIVKTGPNTFVYLNENGMWVSDLISGASAAIGFPTGSTIGNESPGKITVAPWGLYANTGAGDNNIYKSTDGGMNWSVIITANPAEFFEVKTVFYSSDINVVLVGGYTNISTFLTLDSVDSAVYYPTGLDTNKQDTGTYYIFGFGNTYSGGGGGSGVSVLLDAGASTTTNVYATLADLSTANTEIRTSLGNYALSTDVTSEIAADRSSQDASIALTYESKSHASSTYLTILNAASQYYPIANPSGYITSSNAASTYYLQTNPSGYQTAANVTSSLAPYLTSATAASTYYLQTNPSGYQTAANVTSSLAPYLTSSTAASTYKTISSFNSDIANYLLSSTAASTYATLTQFSYLARTNIRVVQLTNSSTTPAPGQAYSTIASALAAAQSGEIVFVMPGTYSESGLTLPAGVELRGLSRFSCIISPIVSTTTTVLTVGGANCKLTDLTLQSTSTTNGANQTIVSIGSTFNTTFFMRNVNLNINGNRADTDTANDICINSTATGAHTNDSIFNFIDCVFKVEANGLGVKRCVLSTGANGDLHFETSQFSCIRGVAGNNYICFEVNGTGTDSQLTNCFLNGTTADISATLGNIQLGKSTVLFNANPNGIAFTTLGGGSDLFYMHTGNASANRWLTIQGEVNNDTPLRIGKPTVVYGLYFNARVLTTGVETITVYKNGVATTLTLTATNTTSASNTTAAVTFNTGDLLSVFANKVSGTVSDYWVQLSLY